MRYVSIVLAIALLSGCSNTRGSGETVGTLAGGAAGALIGSQFGHGTGRLVGTAVGTLGGAMIGSEIGKSMDEQASPPPPTRRYYSEPVYVEPPRKKVYRYVEPEPYYYRDSYY